MSYIGNTSTTQAFTPAVDFFNGNGSTVAFTLSRPVASVAQVQVVISNVPQKPGDAYAVSGNTITFTSAPPSGTSNIYVYYTSPITQVIAPGQGTVTSDSFGVITNFTTTGNTVLGDASTDTLNVGNGGLVKDASGNVGVGVTPSVNSLTSGSMDLKNGIGLFGYNNGFNFSANAYYNGGWKYKATDYASVYIQSLGSHYWSTAPSGTAGNAISFTQALALEHNKTLALQGASPVAGTGITFPASQSASSDANTLDDYEEGAWTPTDGSGAGLTFLSGTSGRYTKIGRCVFVDCEVAYPSTASGASALIAGLPFTSKAVTDYNSGTCMNDANLNIWAFVTSNVSNISVYKSTPTYLNVSNAEFSLKTLYISIWYLTAY
jgi:hypothetical protein